MLRKRDLSWNCAASEVVNDNVGIAQTRFARCDAPPIAFLQTSTSGGVDGPRCPTEDGFGSPIEKHEIKLKGMNGEADAVTGHSWFCKCTKCFKCKTGGKKKVNVLAMIKTSGSATLCETPAQQKHCAAVTQTATEAFIESRYDKVTKISADCVHIVVCPPSERKRL